jgi:hypothetical protein
MILRIYEIRNKNTHRVEHLDYYVDGTKPDEAFRKSPASKHFVNRRDLYIFIREEHFEDVQSALEFVFKQSMVYKLIPSDIPEPPVQQIESYSFGTDPEDPRTNFRLPEEIRQDIFVEEVKDEPTPEPSPEPTQPTGLPKPKVRKPKG